MTLEEIKQMDYKRFYKYIIKIRNELIKKGYATGSTEKQLWLEKLSDTSVITTSGVLTLSAISLFISNNYKQSGKIIEDLSGILLCSSAIILPFLVDLKEKIVMTDKFYAKELKDIIDNLSSDDFECLKDFNKFMTNGDSSWRTLLFLEVIQSIGVDEVIYSDDELKNDKTIAMKNK